MENNSVTKRIFTSVLALSLMTSIGLSAASDYALFDAAGSTIVASAATPTSVAIKDVDMLSTDNMTYESQYSGSAQQYSGTYWGMPFSVAKTGKITLSMTTTSNKLSLLILNSGGTVVGSYDFTGKNNETGSITKSLSSGNYYAVIYNRGITSTTGFTMKISSSTVFDITNSKATSSFKNNPTVPTYTITYNGTTLVKDTDYKVLETNSSSSKNSNGDTVYSYVVKIQGMGNYTGTKTYTFTNTVSNTRYDEYIKEIGRGEDVTFELPVKDTLCYTSAPNTPLYPSIWQSSGNYSYEFSIDYPKMFFFVFAAVLIGGAVSRLLFGGK